MTEATPTPDEAAPDRAIDAAIDAAIGLAGVPMAPEWRPAVHANLTAIAAAARLVTGFPLEDEAEPAPVFRA